MTRIAAAPRLSLLMPVWLGLATAAFLVGGVALWSVNTTIVGAVVASGQVRTQDRAHEVSHTAGGLVVAVLVRDGDRVEAGDPLLELDPGSVDTELTLTADLLADLLARRERLSAEIAGRDWIEVSALTATLMDDIPGLAARLDDQLAILERQVAALRRESDQDGQRILQVREQMRGIEAQIAATEAEMALVGEEMARIQTLIDRGLSTQAQINVVEREIYRFTGELGRMRAQLAELSEKAVETGLEQGGLADRQRRLAQDELDQINPTISDLLARRSKAQRDKGLLTVRAPVAGFVHDLQVKGSGFVLRAGAPAATVIPDSTDLQAILRINTQDIDQVHIGQTAGLRFLAYNSRAMPQLEGVVTAVSADAKLDPLTRASFFEIFVTVDQTALEAQDRKEIVNGMEVLAFVRTAPETPFQYVIGPIADYFRRAFRDRS